MRGAERSAGGLLLFFNKDDDGIGEGMEARVSSSSNVGGIANSSSTDLVPRAPD